MKSFDASPLSHQDFATFPISWSTLVTAITPLPISAHPYLAAVARYTNSDDLPGAILAERLDLAPDPHLDRLLDYVHIDYLLFARRLAASLLGRTAAASSAAFRRFDPEPVKLTSRIEEARFEYHPPLLLEGTMANYLYRYGMNERFYQHHSANHARTLTRELLGATVGDDLDSIVPLMAVRSWGDWFDPHSCSDLTWLLIARQRRQAFVFAFSHSD